MQRGIQTFRPLLSIWDKKYGNGKKSRFRLDGVGPDKDLYPLHLTKKAAIAAERRGRKTKYKSEEEVLTLRIATYSLILDKDTRLPSLVREASSNYPCINSITSPSDIRDMLNAVFHMNLLPEEHTVLVAMDSRGKVIGVFELSHGDLTKSLVGAREIFIRTLLCGAAQFIIAHCHPSGDPTPSAEDPAVTDRLVEAGETIGIPLTDHIIIGENSFYSYRQEGQLLHNHA